MTISHNINPEYTAYYNQARDHQLLRGSKIIVVLALLTTYFIAWNISSHINLSIFGYSIYTLLTAFICLCVLLAFIGAHFLPHHARIPFYATVCASSCGLLSIISAPLLVKIYPEALLQLGAIGIGLLAILLLPTYTLACYLLLTPVIFSSLLFFSNTGTEVLAPLLLMLLLPILQLQQYRWFNQGVRHQFDKEQLRKDLDIAGLLDPISGLKNRKFFDQALEVEMGASRRKNTPLCLLLVSLNNIKQYEYTFGKYAVNQLLERAAVCLNRALFRPRDAAVRYGYNEFIIILPETMLSGSAIVEQRLLQQIDALGLMGVGQPTDKSIHISIRSIELPPKTHRNEARYAIDNAFTELRDLELSDNNEHNID